MIINKYKILLCALGLQLSSGMVLADDKSGKNTSWYIGGGLGITELDPDTGDTGFNVADKGDTGFKLFGGYDFTKRFSVEAFYADLGAAKISSNFVTLPEGEITYTTLGASALWYFWRNGKSEDKNSRKGWQAYVHGGLSFLDNTASSGINFNQENSVQIQYGAAIEYGLNDGIAIRAGLDLYDKDAGMAFVGVLKRFGNQSQRKVVVEPVVEKEIIVEPEPVVIVPAVAVIPDKDTDNDGVIDRLDECADSLPEFKVDEKGCSIIDLEFGAVNFELQSFELTQQSKELLEEVVITINLSPELQQVKVQAHTDSKGPEKYNMKLSTQRAAAVKEYLVSKGVNEKRLIAIGYGESQPIADNETEDGRAKNRRVELSVVEDEKTNSETESRVEDKDR